MSDYVLGPVEPNHQVVNLPATYRPVTPTFDCPVCERTGLPMAGLLMNHKLLACEVCAEEAFEMLLRALKKAKRRVTRSLK